MLMHHPNLPNRAPAETTEEQFQAVWRHLEWAPYTPPEEVQELAAENQQRTVKDILAEVGDEPAAAQRALDAENATEHPRRTLTSQLERIAAPSDTVEPQE